jgi:flagellar biosynthetic protein FliQ
MNEIEAVNIIREVVLVIIRLAMFPMIIALVVGLIISIAQALTQIQEQTLVFIPKILSVFLALIIFFPFIMSQMYEFTLLIMDKIISIS